MKIRSSFVSNSSSSSFVVRYRELWFEATSRLMKQHKVSSSDKLPKKAIKNIKHKKLLTQRKIDDLLDYQFKFSTVTSSYRAEITDNLFECREEDAASLVFSVTCNEDEVVEYLIKHKIPFTASCHYSHYTLIWDGKSDYIHKFLNLGLEAEMYIKHLNQRTSCFDTPAYSKVPLTYWTHPAIDWTDPLTY